MKHLIWLLCVFLVSCGQTTKETDTEPTDSLESIAVEAPEDKPRKYPNSRYAYALSDDAIDQLEAIRNEQSEVLKIASIDEHELIEAYYLDIVGDEDKAAEISSLLGPLEGDRSYFTVHRKEGDFIEFSNNTGEGDVRIQKRIITHFPEHNPSGRQQRFMVTTYNYDGLIRSGSEASVRDLTMKGGENKNILDDEAGVVQALTDGQFDAHEDLKGAYTWRLEPNEEFLFLDYDGQTVKLRILDDGLFHYVEEDL